VVDHLGDVEVSVGLSHLGSPDAGSGFDYQSSDYLEETPHGIEVRDLFFAGLTIGRQFTRLSVR
jgi:hypothetical protein